MTLAWGYARFKRIQQPRIHSVAVLTLTNLSGNPSQEYFVDGMHPLFCCSPASPKMHRSAVTSISLYGVKYMVATCANPACNQEFRELSKGKLFLLPPSRPFSEMLCVQRLIDHCYWLCPECTRSYTVELQDNIPIVRRLPKASVGGVGSNLTSVKRNDKSRIMPVVAL